jgi:methionyl-tRNA formyltransferase
VVAVEPLRALVAEGHDVVLVVSQPDRRRGRGANLVPSPVKAAAVDLGLLVTDKVDDVIDIGADLGVVVAFGRLIKPHVLAALPMVNMHFSLLPRWRGAAPIQRALLAGDKETGVSIMQMDAGLDTGPVISRTVVAIAPRDTAGTLTERLAAAGAGAIVRTLVALAKDGALASQPQDASAATYAGKIERAEASIRWSDDAVAIDRVVRAFNPAPGAFATLHGETIKIWVAEPTSGSFGPAGGIVSADGNGLLVACGRGALLVRELQRAGGRRLPAASFLAGHPVAAGASFDAESD